MNENMTLGARLAAAIDAKTKPPGSLGRLETLAQQLGEVQGTLEPAVRKPTVCVVAADHGAANDGVSAFPQAVTAQMVANFLAGGAAINAFAECSDVALRVIDAGVATRVGPAPGLDERRVGDGTRSFVEAPAMSEAQVDAALANGRLLADELADGGCNVVGLGEMGIGNTASAALLMALLLDLPLAECVGAGTGLDADGIARKTAILQRARERIEGEAPDADAREVLRQAGGFEVATLAGIAIGTASRGGVVLVDGFITTAAALVACQLDPDVRRACVFSHASAERGHRRLLAALDAAPLLQLDMRLGEGTGAALAVPLLRAACAFLREMATFESAAVSGASELER